MLDTTSSILMMKSKVKAGMTNNAWNERPSKGKKRFNSTGIDDPESKMNSAEAEQVITNLAAADLTKNAPKKGIVSDEEKLFAYILGSVTSSKMPHIL